MIRKTVKWLVRMFGAEIISRKTWERAERNRLLGSVIDVRSIDLLSIVADFASALDQPPFFVQVGANDGRKGDPLSRFVREGNWPGILIEPQPDVFATLRENYSDSPNLVFENVAVGTESGVLTLHRFRIPDDARHRPDALTTADRNRLLRARTKFGWNLDIEEIQVPMATLTSLLLKHRCQEIDILVIDTEGMDYTVIQSLDFARFQPRLIQFEHIHLANDVLEECVALLATHGYRFMRADRDIIAYRQLPPERKTSEASRGRTVLEDKRIAVARA